MKNHKLVFAVGLLALAAVLYAGYFAWLARKSADKTFQTITTDRETGEVEETVKEQPLPAATGDLNDLTQAISTDLDNQAVLLDSLETEADFITSDSAAIEGFGQAYNENDF